MLKTYPRCCCCCCCCWYVALFTRTRAWAHGALKRACVRAYVCACACACVYVCVCVYPTSVCLRLVKVGPWRDFTRWIRCHLHTFHINSPAFSISSLLININVLHLDPLSLSLPFFCASVYGLGQGCQVWPFRGQKNQIWPFLNWLAF